jgi:predicted SAM-dependent methyltransferase
MPILSPIRLLNAFTKRANILDAKLTRVARYHKAKRLWKSAPLRLNIGCGQKPFPGWVNLDFDPRYANGADLFWDVAHGLPFPADSCQFIYNEHVLEHIPVKEGVTFLAECLRVLQPGGVLRIGMPCLADVVRQYQENDWRGPWMAEVGCEEIQTRAECINIGFRAWGHQWLYDAEELERRMREAGFVQIESMKWGESNHEALRSRETRPETLLIMEATKSEPLASR